MNLNLRNKFLIPTAILVVAGITALSVAGYTSSRGAILTGVKEQIVRTAEVTEKMLGAWIERTQLDMSSWATQAVYQTAVEDSFKGTAARKTASMEMENLKTNYKFYEDIFLANTQGDIVAASSGLDEKQVNVADRKYFADSMKGAVCLSEVILSKVSGNPVFVVSAPVKQQDAVVGVLLGAIRLDFLNSQFIDPVKVGKKGYAYMVNPEGLLIAHPEKSEILKLNIGQYDFGRKILQEKNGMVSGLFKGIDGLTAFKQNAAAGWTICVMADTFEMLEPIRRVGVVSGVIAVLILICLWGGMYFMAGSFIIKPIQNVLHFAEKLEKGDLSVRLKAGSDEVGKMGLALNAVIDGLNNKDKLAAAIANGDLTLDIHIASNEDTLGKSLKTMVDSLNSIVSELYNAANQVDQSSQQVSQSSQSLSQGATEQASSLEEITSSITEISSQTKTTAENANQASSLAKTVREAAEGGVKQMKEMTEAMDMIRSASQETAKIIKTIDSISFQTNLLALNAAVESARAGKHGKGFAVVAQEVRTLAARSAKAAQETTELIESAVRKINDGGEIAGRTASALDNINTGIAKVADLVVEIAAASNEQAQGITQINTGLSQIDGVTQQNTANAEETSAAAEELSAQAKMLRKTLTHFKMRGNSRRGDFSSQFSGKPDERVLALDHPSHSAAKWGEQEITRLLPAQEQQDFDL